MTYWIFPASVGQIGTATGFSLANKSPAMETRLQVHQDSRDQRFDHMLYYIPKLVQHKLRSPNVVLCLMDEESQTTRISTTIPSIMSHGVAEW
jgi:hypothetical protein